MDRIKFEWDENKNLINIKKHSISFDVAKEVFYDNFAILFDDPEHSINEERFLIIGQNKSKKVCIVSHCYRESNEIIRIISAREATRKEKQIYNEGF